MGLLDEAQLNHLNSAIDDAKGKMKELDDAFTGAVASLRNISEGTERAVAQARGQLTALVEKDYAKAMAEIDALLTKGQASIDYLRNDANAYAARMRELQAEVERARRTAADKYALDLAEAQKKQREAEKAAAAATATAAASASSSASSTSKQTIVIKMDGKSSEFTGTADAVKDMIEMIRRMGGTVTNK
ncbi:MAG TPA: hypothetical protein VJ001_06840 [Rhodocyclaceae bacterium]|nr:hypothetical protein [Rhodocyclaceae bacterium]